jgi:hypothetical protein
MRQRQHLAAGLTTIAMGMGRAATQDGKPFHPSPVCLVE